MMKETRINVTINEIKNTEKENKTMKKMNKETRMEVLKAAGIDTNDMLQFILENGNKAEIDKLLAQYDEDPVVKQLKAEGYVKNPDLYRRWIMAQMFRNLNFETWDGKHKGYNYYLDNCLDFKYQVEFMLDEVNRIIHIWKDGDIEKRKEYSRICTLEAIKESCKEICDKVRAKYRYQRNSYVDEKLKKLSIITEVIWMSTTYHEIYEDLKMLARILRWFNMDGVKKSPTWKDMYKGIGAYWTCKNMIMFHNCVVGDFFQMNRYDSMNILEQKAREYFAHPDYFNRESEGGFRMFAFMKQLIEDNHFDFGKRMEEIGVPRHKYAYM